MIVLVVGLLFSQYTYPKKTRLSCSSSVAIPVERHQAQDSHFLRLSDAVRSVLSLTVRGVGELLTTANSVATVEEERTQLAQ